MGKFEQELPIIRVILILAYFSSPNLLHGTLDLRYCTEYCIVQYKYTITTVLPSRPLPVVVDPTNKSNTRGIQSIHQSSPLAHTHFNRPYSNKPRLRQTRHRSSQGVQ